MSKISTFSFIFIIQKELYKKGILETLSLLNHGSEKQDGN